VEQGWVRAIPWLFWLNLLCVDVGEDIVESAQLGGIILVSETLTGMPGGMSHLHIQGQLGEVMGSKHTQCA